MGAGRARRAHVPARLAPARSRRGHRAGRDPRAAGHGVRRARRRAGGVRAVRDDRLPASATRVFGPSRVLVLGPDSSVSPLIFAAIVPLAVPGDVQTRVALAGMLALLVGLIEIAMGLGRLGFVADLLSSEVQVGYMNGLAITIIVGQLPKLCGFSTDATSFGGEVVAWFEHLDETKAAALVVGVGGARRPARAPSGDDARSPRCSSPSSARRCVSAVLGLSDHIATVGTLPSGFPKPTVPWTSIDDVVAAAHRRGRDHARLADRHDRDVGVVRGPARRRRRPEPGDDRPRRREPRRRVPAGVRGVDERVAHRGRRAVGREEPADRTRRRGPRRHAPRAVPVVARRPPAVGARRRGDRRRAVAVEPRRAPSLRVGAAVRARAVAHRIRRRDRARRAPGHRRSRSSCRC